MDLLKLWCQCVRQYLVLLVAQVADAEVVEVDEIIRKELLDNSNGVHVAVEIAPVGGSGKRELGEATALAEVGQRKAQFRQERPFGRVEQLRVGYQSRSVDKHAGSTISQVVRHRLLQAFRQIPRLYIQGGPKKLTTAELSIEFYWIIISLPLRLDFLVSHKVSNKYDTILSLGVKNSMRDIICDVNYFA